MQLTDSSNEGSPSSMGGHRITDALHVLIARWVLQIKLRHDLRSWIRTIDNMRFRSCLPYSSQRWYVWNTAKSCRTLFHLYAYDAQLLPLSESEALGQTRTWVCKRSATTWYLLSIACAPLAIMHIITADISSITMSNDSTCGWLPINQDAQQISSVVA